MTIKKRRKDTTKKISHHISTPIVDELKRVAFQRRVTEYSFIEAALEIFLSQTEQDAIVARRLDRLHRQNEKLNRDQHILLETLILFIKVFLAQTEETPESERVAAKDRGAKRFNNFTNRLLQVFQEGRLYKDVIEEKMVQKNDYDGAQA